ncbi:hypothetical protein AMTR_s00037p00038160 [Amborella trichopoda]|uniref:Myb/SANT-like domain-containing protein n=1 Tax=Amborella trichopoda TaxID=13333 RepID=U5D4Z9_AMBTC|nr:hypothetical protein AMTR_s00037p00038160 [Amborella trichopoda]
MAVSGFGWDDSRRIVTAKSAVWNDFLAENKWANKYHNNTLPEYSLLSKIYEGSTTDGTYKSIGLALELSQKGPTLHSLMTPLRSPAMIEMAHSIKMLASDIVGNSSTLVVDSSSKAKREALKTVEGMWRAGEVGDNVLVMAARIFQDSIKGRC